jgi:hypothetical protein
VAVGAIGSLACVPSGLTRSGLLALPDKTRQGMRVNKKTAKIKVFLLLENWPFLFLFVFFIHSINQ